MVPLNGASLDEAKADYARLTTERADDRLRPLGLTPLLADYIAVHTQALAVSGKRASSVQKETACRKRILHLPSSPALRHAFRSWTCGDRLPRICHRPLNSERRSRDRARSAAVLSRSGLGRRGAGKLLDRSGVLKPLRLRRNLNNSRGRALAGSAALRPIGYFGNRVQISQHRARRFGGFATRYFVSKTLEATPSGC